jgi:hypothetical protein
MLGNAWRGTGAIDERAVSYDQIVHGVNVNA